MESSLEVVQNRRLRRKMRATSNKQRSRSQYDLQERVVQDHGTKWSPSSSVVFCIALPLPKTMLVRARITHNGQHGLECDEEVLCQGFSHILNKLESVVGIPEMGMLSSGTQEAQQ